MAEEPYITSVEGDSLSVALLVVAHNATVFNAERSADGYIKDFEKIYKALKEATAPPSTGMTRHGGIRGGSNS